MNVNAPLNSPPSSRHRPVMVNEVMDGLNVRNGGIFADVTEDGGSHTLEIFRRAPDSARVIGADLDGEMLKLSETRLAEYRNRLTLVQENFANVKLLLSRIGVEKVNGLLADLGMSSNQLDDPVRGLSFQTDGPLDMRFNPLEGESASELIERLEASELSRLFEEYGEEPFARPIARRIKEQARLGRMKTTGDLAQTILEVVHARPGRAHPATRVFQALRIAVNQEMTNLDRFLHDVIDVLAPGGRLCVITYHSLEDQRVRRTFRRWAKPCQCPPRLPCVCGARPMAATLTPKGLSPKAEEIQTNPRARSAKLWIAERSPA